jgi:translation initiation factor 1
MPNKESRLVYSTETGRIKTPSESKPTIISDGIIRISRETKGRKGKGVTLISGFNLNPSDLKALAKKLKKSCSTGGTTKDGIIEIQGDHREVLKNQLEKMGHTVKLAGG